MSVRIETEWKVKPASGITIIELSDLGCKNQSAWDSLTEDEQRKKINEYLLTSDQPSLIPLATDWSVEA